MNTVSKTVSDETLNAIIQIESKGQIDARPIDRATGKRLSSALGLGQFLDATWLGVVKKHRPDLLEGRMQADVLALRISPQIAVELLARFTEDNQRAIGMNCTGGDLYLAHFLGVAAAKDFFRADPATPVSKLVTIDVINANRSIMLGKTAGQVRAWAARRMHESSGHDWVARYYKPPAEAAPPAEPEVAPVEEETAEDIPDPQDAPAVGPAVDRDPVPPVTPAPTAETPAGGFFPWIMKIVKSKIAWATTALGGVSMASIFNFITDWRTISALVVLVLVLYVIYERGKKP